MIMATRHAKQLYFIIHLLLITALGQQETTVSEVFTSDPEPRLANPITLSCAKDGEKIKISDILYVVNGCRSSEVRPEHPAAGANRVNIEKCTGRRTCTILSTSLSPPFLPRRSGCLVAQAYHIKITYSCVPQDKIHSMCADFTIQNRVGYLSTPHYPELLSPGVPIAPCRCDLEATLNSRIIFTLLEANLASNTSDKDPSSCQVDEQRQYLHIQYNHEMAEMYMLCSHKYNFQVQASPTYKLQFENPIYKRAGALWMQYSAEDQNAVVTVQCYKPVVTTIEPIFYTGKPDNKLILGILLAILLIISLVIIVMVVRYRRRLHHFMMYKYSKKSPQQKTRHPPPSKGAPEAEVYPEVRFDSLTEQCESESFEKPTAHIPPQSFSEERLSEEYVVEKNKKCNGKPQNSTFKSSYLPKKSKDVSESDSYESKKSHERTSDSTSSQSSSVASTSKYVPHNDITDSQPVYKLKPPPVKPKPPPVKPKPVQISPTYEDIWVRVVTPEDGMSMRSVSSHHECDMSQPQQEKEAISLPLIHVNSMQFIDDSRSHTTPSPIEEEDEMDIKVPNPKLVPISPFRIRHHSQTSRSGSEDRSTKVKPQPGSQSSMSLDSAGRYRNSRGHTVTAPISSFHHNSRLLVDLPPKKSRSLGGHNRQRQSSVPILLAKDGIYARINKQPPRRNSTTSSNAAISQRETNLLADQVYRIAQQTRAKPRPPTRTTTSPSRSPNLTIHSRNANGHMPKLQEGDDEYIIRVEKEYDFLSPP